METTRYEALKAEYDEQMQLPEGKHCEDCKFFKFCHSLFQCPETNTSCDWFPSRFAQSAEVSP